MSLNSWLLHLLHHAPVSFLTSSFPNKCRGIYHFAYSEPGLDPFSIRYPRTVMRSTIRGSLNDIAPIVAAPAKDGNIGASASGSYPPLECRWGRGIYGAKQARPACTQPQRHRESDTATQARVCNPYDLSTFRYLLPY